MSSVSGTLGASSDTVPLTAERWTDVASCSWGGALAIVAPAASTTVAPTMNNAFRTNANRIHASCVWATTAAASHRRLVEATRRFGESGRGRDSREIHAPAGHSG